MMFRLAADAVLLVHALFVGFVVFGLVLVLIGGVFSWSWVRNFWFRAAHLAAIGIVVLQAWGGIVCPLTTLEATLRAHAGDITYTGSFVAYWLDRLLYYQAPAWVFILAYTLFAGAVIASWFWVRPRARSA